ncbi:unnamed protein product [Rotaria magnacalcarata]|uniref:Uncharacterized protein n=1 Tax=Rotaria magnacalcarata TaxID=392030 RepID=A0A816GS89_9BILA|nr:unnamed protein product [Rotaria magnacalcarata]
MMGMAADYGLDMKIVDDKNYQPTEEDKAKGTNIIVFTHGTSDEQGKIGIGHFQLKLPDGEVIDLPGERNNCGYCVFQKILRDRGIEKSIDDLRNDRAASIEDNPQQFAKVNSAQEWIRTRYPQQANNLLTVGVKHPEDILNDPKLPSRKDL